jgi:hypothetical protein
MECKQVYIEDSVQNIGPSKINIVQKSKNTIRGEKYG